jgi:hypothetical protein
MIDKSEKKVLLYESIKNDILTPLNAAIETSIITKEDRPVNIQGLINISIPNRVSNYYEGPWVPESLESLPCIAVTGKKSGMVYLFTLASLLPGLDIFGK